MKVAIINNIFDPFQRGGADKISRKLADGFIEAGDEVFFIAAKPYWSKEPNSKYRGYFINSLFYDLKNIPAFCRLFWHVFDMFDARTCYQVSKILKQEKPDLVVTNNLKGLGFLIPLAIARQNIKHLHIAHDIQLIHPSGLMFWGKESSLNSLSVLIYSRLNRLLFRKTYSIITPSKWLMDLHRQHNFFQKSKQIIMPNPVDLDNSSTKDSAKNKFSILFVGEIVKHKGIRLFVEAVNTLQNKFPDIKAVIIGEGSDETWLKKALDNSKINFLGKLKNSEVKKIMAKAGIVIVPSLCYENSPTVIYEARQSDCLVIASRIGGITELIHEIGGLLFVPGNKNDLIKKIEFSLNNYDKLQCQFEEKKKNLKKYQLDNYIKDIKKI